MWRYLLYEEAILWLDKLYLIMNLGNKSIRSLSSILLHIWPLSETEGKAHTPTAMYWPCEVVSNCNLTEIIDQKAGNLSYCDRSSWNHFISSSSLEKRARLSTCNKMVHTIVVWCGYMLSSAWIVYVIYCVWELVVNEHIFNDVCKDRMWHQMTDYHQMTMLVILMENDSLLTCCDYFA